MAIWTLAKKEFRLLLRDRLAALLLLVLPLVCILLLGLLLGEGFWERPDQKLRVSVCNLDEGYAEDGVAREAIPPTSVEEVSKQAVSFLSLTPAPGEPVGAQSLAAAALAHTRLKRVSWAHLVIKDLEETAGIRIEYIPTRQEARRLCDSRQRSAVIVFGPNFSKLTSEASFLNEGLNPFYRDGVNMSKLDITVERDSKAKASAAIIDQVTQVTMLRVVLPYMIGRAFERLGTPEFIDSLGEEVKLPMPEDFKSLTASGKKLLKDPKVTAARFLDKKLDADLKDMEEKINKFEPLVERDRVKLAELIELASGNDESKSLDFRGRIGDGVQGALQKQFGKYNLTGKTWASLTRSDPRTEGVTTDAPPEEGGLGPLKFGAARYQILVPTFTVMFAYLLILIVGWLFVAERTQGTLKRLRAAPLTRAQILLGKTLSCFVVSFLQGFVLLLLGKLVFGMRWGPEGWSIWQQLMWVTPVVAATSLSAVGMAMLVAAVARTPIQVFIVSAVVVLLSVLIIIPNVLPYMMPEEMKVFTLVTPHAWALEAYTALLPADATDQVNLLTVPESWWDPNVWDWTAVVYFFKGVVPACVMLSLFGVVFLALAWWIMPLD